MTVSSSLSTQTFSCDGSTTVFTCPFRVLEASELVGYLITVATNESTLLVNGTDFTVTGVGAANAIATTTTTYSTAYQVNFRRRTQRLQSTDYRDNDPFPAESHENALDRLTHIAQESDADIGRALLAPEPEAGITLPSAADRSNKLLGFNSSGLPIAVAPADGSSAALALDLANTASAVEGDALIGVKSPLTGGVARTQHGKNADAVSIADFGAVGDNTTDDTAEINAALASGAKFVTAPTKSTFYKITDAIVIPAGVTFDAQGAKFRQATAGKAGFNLAGADAKIFHAVIQGSASNAGGAFEGGANGIYALDADRFEVRGCTVYGFEYNGVYERNCDDFVIDNNLFYANRYISNTSADVLLYSSVLHRGGTITNNRCYSNNSQGIFACALGNDSDCTITGNRCIAMTDALVPVATPNVLRRHGIVLGYANATTRRHVVVGNVIKVTSSTGIYYQGPSDASVGSVLIAYNYITDTGIDTVQPDLSSGINLACQGEGDVVVGNVIENTFTVGTLGVSAGISLQPNPGTSETSNNRHTLISGNTVTNSLGSGIQVIFQAANATVVNNTITGSALAGVYVAMSAIPGGSVNSCRVLSNVIRHRALVQPAIHIEATASAGSITVKDNEINGLNNTTDTIVNTGIYLANANTGSNPVTIEGNTVRNFRNGVAPANYLTGQVPTVVVRANRFIDCFTGVAASSLSSAGRLVAVGNDYVNCTNRVGAGTLAGTAVVWDGALLNGTVTVYQSAAPTTGTWSAGDRAIRNPPAVGQPKAWSCTVAGAPGTWVSEGNL